ncbi:MAG: type II secretion system F family protein [Chloroflexota bacterium]
MNYHYVAYSGNGKVARGTVPADSIEAADELLNQLGYQVLSLKPIKPFLLEWDKLFPTFFRVKTEDIIIFSRQLALLIKSGISIVTSLELLEAQISNRLFRRVLGEINIDLRSGSRFSEALAKYPAVFPPIYCRTLGVGEQTGEMEKILTEIADYMGKEETTRKGVKSALSYPILVSVVAVIVVAILVNFVLPTFIGFYRTLGAELPAPTRLLLTISDVTQKYGLYMLVALAAAAVGIALYIRTPVGRYRWDRLALKAPLIGKINHLNELSYCCRTMSVLFRSGLPMTEIMDIVTGSSNNTVMIRSLTEIRQAMLKGEGISQPMSKDPIFLPMMVQMVQVGEETGSLDITLRAVAETYDAESESRTHSLTGLIQPALTLFIGLIVAFVTISMLSAMYAVYGQMT